VDSTGTWLNIHLRRVSNYPCFILYPSTMFKQDQTNDTHLSGLSTKVVSLRHQFLPIQWLLHPFNDLFSRTTWVSRQHKGKTSLDLNEARDDRVLRRSGISWTVCYQPAPCSRQRTTSTPHHSSFTGRMLFLTPTDSVKAMKASVPIPWIHRETVT